MTAPRTKSQNGRRSRSKGHAWERDVARLLAVIWPGAERNIAQTRTAAREGCDVLHTPYWIETKCGGAVDVAAAWKQAERDRAASRGINVDARPIALIVKEDRRRPFIVVEVSEPGDAPALGDPYLRARIDLAQWVAFKLTKAAAHGAGRGPNAAPRVPSEIHDESNR